MDSTIQQTAYRALHKLQMKNDDLDTFVAKFKHLAGKAQFGINDSATKDLFAHALSRPILEAVLRRETFNPMTADLDAWITAARDEIQRTENQYSMLGKWPTHWKSPSQSKGGFQRSSHSYHTPSHRSSHRSSNDQVVPMDIDVIRRAVSDEQKKKFRQEGRCFECQKQGHMARYCPNKKKPSQGRFQPQKTQSKFNKRKPSPFKTKTSYARVINMDDEESYEDSDDEDIFTAETSISGSDDSELNISDLAAHTARFNDSERDEWVKEMKKLGVDF